MCIFQVLARSGHIINNSHLICTAKGKTRISKVNKAKLYAYIDTEYGTPSAKPGRWVKLSDVDIDINESVLKLSWRAEDWGSNNVVLKGSDLNRIVGKTMTMCDAMLADKEQKEAFKQLLKDTIYGWHDEIFNRYQLDETKVK